MSRRTARVIAGAVGVSPQGEHAGAHEPITHDDAQQQLEGLSFMRLTEGMVDRDLALEVASAPGADTAVVRRLEVGVSGS